MLEKAKKNVDLILYTLGFIAAIGLLFISEKLSAPIKGREFHQLKDEMMNNFSLSIANVIREAFGKNELMIEKSYSYFSNLFIPMVLVIIAALILISIIWYLGKSVINDEDNLFDKILKLLLAVATGFVVFLAMKNELFLLILNLKMALLILVMCAFFIFLLSPSRNPR
jgi:hypothetical protein